MSSGNWDLWVLNEKGEPTDGSFTSPLGVKVEFYKNWLYVGDERAWREGGRFMEPVVLNVHSGQLVYQDVDIWAVRGPQEGVYAAVWTADGRGIVGMGRA